MNGSTLGLLLQLGSTSRDCAEATVVNATSAAIITKIFFTVYVPSQGWTALILDTNGNGKRDDQTSRSRKMSARQRHPDDAIAVDIHPARYESIHWCPRLGVHNLPELRTWKRIQRPALGAMSSGRARSVEWTLALAPVETIWGSVLSYPGGVVRLMPGDSPPQTALAEYYEVPFNAIPPKTSASWPPSTGLVTTPSMGQGR
jgi:hypothetical protein